MKRETTYFRGPKVETRFIIFPLAHQIVDEKKKRKSSAVHFADPDRRRRHEELKQISLLLTSLSPSPSSSSLSSSGPPIIFISGSLGLDAFYQTSAQIRQRSTYERQRRRRRRQRSDLNFLCSLKNSRQKNTRVWSQSHATKDANDS